MSMKLSVVMTTYNGEKDVLEQLESLKKQILQPDEVLIADDQSTDRTVEIVNQYIEDNDLENWHIKVNDENLGWKRNFIKVADESSGDLIFFCDQDDIWMKHKLYVMSDIMTQNDQIDVLAGRYVKFIDSLPEKSELKIENEGIHKVEVDNHLITNELPGCVYCVRRSFWNRVSKHWNGTLAHDRLCWAPARESGSLYILEMPVIYWRRHENSATTISHKSMKKNEYRCEAIEEERRDLDCLKEVMDDLGAEDSFYDRLIRYREFYDIRIDMLRCHNPLKAFPLLKYIDCYDRKKQFLLEIYLSMRRN